MFAPLHTSFEYAGTYQKELHLTTNLCIWYSNTNTTFALSKIHLSIKMAPY